MSLNSKSGVPNSQSESRENARGGVLTLLVVDDEVILRQLAARILRRENYIVLEAGSAGAALEECARGGPVDMLVSDVNLPDFDGFALLEQLRRNNPALKAVLMSGSSLDSNVRRCCVPAGTLYLEKPFDPGELVSAVRDAMQS